MPYTYLVRCVPTNQFYYGVRTSHKVDPAQDLWNHYFTSSSEVKALIQRFGKDAFEYEIRKEFESSDAARLWEHKVLRRMKVTFKDEWLNRALMSGGIRSQESIQKQFKTRTKTYPHHSAETIEKIRKSNLGKIVSDEARIKMSLAKKGKPSPNKGKTFSSEWKAKLRAARKIQFEKNHPRLGKKHNEHTINKLSSIMSNKRWIYNPVTRKRTMVDKDQLGPYLESGWLPGKKI